MQKFLLFTVGKSHGTLHSAEIAVTLAALGDLEGDGRSALVTKISVGGKTECCQPHSCSSASSSQIMRKKRKKRQKKQRKHKSLQTALRHILFFFLSIKKFVILYLNEGFARWHHTKSFRLKQCGGFATIRWREFTKQCFKLSVRDFRKRILFNKVAEFF